MADKKTTPAAAPAAETAPAPKILEPKTLAEGLALISAAPMREMVAQKLSIPEKLTRENNSRVLSLREAEAVDPENPEFLDKVWHRVVAERVDDPEITEAEKKFQLAEAEREKQLKILRAAAKARHVRPPMSDEEKAKLRKLVNEGKGLVEEERAKAEGIAELVDGMLKMEGKEIKGGLISLLPPLESLLNKRAGRKSKGDGGVYSTRMVDSFIDGVSANVEKKRKSTGEMYSAAHFNFIAEKLSKRFGVGQFPENGVTAEELETAYYASKNVEYRNAGEMPEDHTFKFTKTVKVQNPNDDSTTDVPQTVSIRIVRKYPDAPLPEPKPLTDDEKAKAAEEAKKYSPTGDGKNVADAKA